MNNHSRCSSASTTRRIVLLLIALALLLIGVTPEKKSVLAHDPGLSSVVLEIRPGGFEVELTMARGDLDMVLRKKTGSLEENFPSDFALERGELLTTAAEAIEVNVDNRRATFIRATILGSDEADTDNIVRLSAVYSCEPGARLRVRSMILARLSRGHRQYVTVVTSNEGKVAEQILDAAHDSFEVEMADRLTRGASRSVANLIGLGVEHILTGYDHLAFLLALLIVSTNLRGAAKLITSFTVAHSLTLAFGTLGFVRISPAVVEPLIAASIVFVGIENVWRPGARYRWLLTFCFGLIHGFGFATALNDLGIGKGASVAVPLFSFNLGVELGQLAISVILLPVFYKLRKRSSFTTHFVPACSGFVAVAGGVWLIQRTLSIFL